MVKTMQYGIEFNEPDPLRALGETGCDGQSASPRTALHELGGLVCQSGYRVPQLPGVLTVAVTRYGLGFAVRPPDSLDELEEPELDGVEALDELDELEPDELPDDC